MLNLSPFTLPVIGGAAVAPPPAGLDHVAKSSIDFDVEKFENSGDANVLDPAAQAWINKRLMDVPGDQRWTDHAPTTQNTRGYDTWLNLVNRVRYRIQDAAPAAEVKLAQQQQRSSFWSGVLGGLDTNLGRARTNTLIGYAPPPPGSPPGTLSVGENAADPANRGRVDDLADQFGDWLPWVAIGLGAVALVVVVVAVRS